MTVPGTPSTAIPVLPLPTPPDAPCADVRAHLDDLVCDAADALTAARAAAHLDGCPACQRALLGARAYRRAMRGLEPATPAPERLRRRVDDILRQVRESHPS